MSKHSYEFGFRSVEERSSILMNIYTPDNSVLVVNVGKGNKTITLPVSVPSFKVQAGVTQDDTTVLWDESVLELTADDELAEKEGGVLSYVMLTESSAVKAEPSVRIAEPLQLAPELPEILNDDED